MELKTTGKWSPWKSAVGLRSGLGIKEGNVWNWLVYSWLFRQTLCVGHDNKAGLLLACDRQWETVWGISVCLSSIIIWSESVMQNKRHIGLLTDRYVSNKLHGVIVSILERTLGFGWKKDLNDNSALVGMTDLSLAVTLTKPVNPLGFSFLIFQREIIIPGLISKDQGDD